MTIYELFKQYAARLAIEQFDESGNTTLSIRQANGFYVAAVHPNDLQPQDIRFVEEGNDAFPLLTAIYKKHRRINAVIITNTANCAAFARKKCNLPAILDDMAEIVGTVAKYVTDVRRATKAVAVNNCAFVEGVGAVSVGSTLFEAYIAATVLEKSSFVYLNALKLGAPKRINGLEARLMHYVYRKKYLKKEQISKMAEMEVEK